MSSSLTTIVAPHRRRRRAAVAVALAAVLGATAVTSPAAGTSAAFEPPTTNALRAAAVAQAPAATADLELVPLAPGLDEVDISGPEFDAATELVGELTTKVLDSTQARVTAIAALFDLRERDADLSDQLSDARARSRLATARIAKLKTLLQDIAVANYISGRSPSGSTSMDMNLDSRRHNELGSQKVMVGVVNTDKLTKLRLTRAALSKARTDIATATAALEEVRGEIKANEDLRDRSTFDQVKLSAALVQAVLDREDTRFLAEVDGLDIPLVVLNAYVRAADLAAAESPRCGIQWWALAGIGLTESKHGTYGGAEVRADGTLTKPILGIPLDGSNETAVVPGPGGFDRAQGPMQFISSTWASWGRDGNGDGERDVQNLYDAAAGAAAYLCAGGAMVSDPDLQRGYLSYNQSLFYVAQVLGQARSYEAALRLRPAEAPPEPADEPAT